MTDDLRAAAEIYVDWTSGNHCPSHRAQLMDAFVAGAWRNAPPADDAEPVTEEWLREVGFEPPPMLESALHSLSLRCVQVRWYGSTPPHGEWIVMNEKRWEFIRGIPAPTTRGAVRRLLAALNIAPPKG